MQSRKSAEYAMKVTVRHSDQEDLDRISRYTRRLLRRTLETNRHRIRSVTVNVGLSTGLHMGEFDYHCTVQIVTTRGHKVTAEARDCDEILVVYRAIDRVSHLVESQALDQMGTE